MKSNIIFLIGILYVIGNSGCQDLNLLEKEQELISYFKNEYVEELETKEEYVALSYNIHMGFTKDQNPFESNSIGGSPEHLLDLVEALRSVNPDFISLQDVARNVSSTLVKDQIKFIAKELRMNYAYADYSEVNSFHNIFLRGTRGHAFLTPYEITQIKNIEILNENKYESRTCLTVEVRISPDKKLAFLNTHFQGGASDKSKEAEVNKILEIKDNQIFPVMLLGDFNNTINNSHIKRIHSEMPSVVTLISDEERNIVEFIGTSGSPSSGLNIIDNIFVEKNKFHINKVGIMEEQYWNVSDHRFIYTSFAL